MVGAGDTRAEVNRVGEEAAEAVVAAAKALTDTIETYKAAFESLAATSGDMRTVEANGQFVEAVAAVNQGVNMFLAGKNNMVMWAASAL